VSAFLARNRLIVLAYVGMLVLLVLTTLFSPGFLSETNLRSTVVLAAFVGIVALGQTFVIIGGGVDLSVPWVLNCAAILMAAFCGGESLPLLWVVPVLLGAGALIGWMNGAGVAFFGVPAIIMTLATNVILQGLIVIYTGGLPTPPAPDAIRFLAVGRIGPIPVIGILWAVLAVLASLLMSKTAFGRYLYAVGSNATVAEFSGVPTARTTIWTYVLSGMTAALAGMLLTGYSGQAYLGMGDPYLFTSIAAVAIGGASILGGTGHYIGTVAGALVLTILAGLLPALGLSTGALMVVYGAVILVTVAIGSDVFSGGWRLFFPRRADPDRGSLP
jgi:ribose transport system permease protein